MQLTTRDIQLIVWINRVGHVTIQHIGKQLSISQATAYLLVKRLVKAGFLNHQRFFHGMPGSYWVTPAGVAISNSPMPPLRKVILGTYHHDLLAVSLGQMLVASGGGEFVPERWLRHLEGKSGFGPQTHFADGVWELPEGKKIALEVELTTKSRKRRETIVRNYTKQFAFDEVRYYCASDAVAKPYRELATSYSFLKVNLVSDILPHSPWMRVA